MENRRNFIKQTISVMSCGILCKLTKVKPKPKDVILVTIPDCNAVSDVKEIYQKFKKVFPGNEVLIMTDNIRVEVSEFDNANSISKSS